MKKRNVSAVLLMAVLLLSACVKTEPVKTDLPVEENGAPHVGVTDTDTDYDGFKYLYKERFITPRQKKSGKENGGKDIFLYVPESDDPMLGRSDIRCDRLGVAFEARLNPDDMLNEDYTLKELLDQYMQRTYEPGGYYNYKYREQISIEETAVSEDGKTAVAKAAFFEQVYTDDYQYMEETLAIHQMDDGTMIWIAVRINAAEASSRTSELIGEINTFYGDIVQWDGEAAEKKLKEFEEQLASKKTEADDSRFQTEYMSFDLPSGWEEIYGTYMGAYLYAPEYGYSSEQMLMVDRADTEVSGSEVQEAIEKETLTDEVIRDLLEAGDEKLTYSYAQGSLGKAVCVELSQDIEDMEADVTAYITVGDDGAIYRMISYVTGGSDRQETAKEALDLMFQTAELADY